MSDGMSESSSPAGRTTSVPSACGMRDLVGKVFFTHYEPRVRDNERLMLASRPLLGGPFAR